jgi:hypothetical protein
MTASLIADCTTPAEHDAYFLPVCSQDTLVQVKLPYTPSSHYQWQISYLPDGLWPELHNAAAHAVVAQTLEEDESGSILLEFVALRDLDHDAILQLECVRLWGDGHVQRVVGLYFGASPSA